MNSKFKRKQRNKAFHYLDLLGNDIDAEFSKFLPLKWQEPAFLDTSPVLLLTGSAGGGKSRIAAEKVHRFCLDNPGSCWLMLRKAREWCSKSIVPFFYQTVIDGDPRVKYMKGQAMFVYDNGSVVYTGGMMDDKQRESIRSIGGAGGLDGVWMEEANAFTRIDFEELNGRLRGSAGDYRQIIMTTNPDSSLHWINQDLILGGGAKVYFSSAKDNPTNPDDYFESLNRLTGLMYERLVLGKWVVNPEGKAFKHFSRDTHVKPFTQELLSYFRVIIRSIDFGGWKAVTWVGLDFDDCAWVFAEWEGRDYTIEQMSHEINVIEGNLGIVGRINDTVTDHAFQERFELEKYGIVCALAEKSIPLGLDIIRRRIRPHKGDTMFFICDTCPQAIMEFENYEVDEFDKPKKAQHDHETDAIRYNIVELDKYCIYGFSSANIYRVQS